MKKDVYAFIILCIHFGECKVSLDFKCICATIREKQNKLMPGEMSGMQHRFVK